MSVGLFAFPDVSWQEEAARLSSVRANDSHVSGLSQLPFLRSLGVSPTSLRTQPTIANLRKRLKEPLLWQDGDKNIKVANLLFQHVDLNPKIFYSDLSYHMLKPQDVKLPRREQNCITNGWGIRHKSISTFPTKHLCTNSCGQGLMHAACPHTDVSSDRPV